VRWRPVGAILAWWSRSRRLARARPGARRVGPRQPLDAPCAARRLARRDLPRSSKRSSFYPPLVLARPARVRLARPTRRGSVCRLASSDWARRGLRAGAPFAGATEEASWRAGVRHRPLRRSSRPALSARPPLASMVALMLVVLLRTDTSSIAAGSVATGLSWARHADQARRRATCWRRRVVAPDPSAAPLANLALAR